MSGSTLCGQKCQNLKTIDDGRRPSWISVIMAISFEPIELETSSFDIYIDNVSEATRILKMAK